VLGRFGGLRTPSESLALRWHDVDWANSRLTIRSPKTEHHHGRGVRVIPIFPEIREPLMEVFELAPEGAEHVITRYRSGCGLRPGFRRIIQRAGLQPWPRTWHNLRASRQTELAMDYPLHTACAWIGNTKAIAAGHYLQVTDADWQRAVSSGSGAQSGAQVAQSAAQHLTAMSREKSQSSSTSPRNTDVSHFDAKHCDSMQTTLQVRGGSGGRRVGPCGHRGARVR